MNQFGFDEINIAANLLESLWAQPIQQGPTAGSYAEFLKQTFAEKLRRVRTGEYSVMCSGFRDLFVHAAFSVPGLKVRPVEAVNYHPQLPDLITYGHSTAEIWVQKLNAWVLFDPWLGIIVTKDGMPINSDLLNKARSEDRIVIVPVIKSVPRMYRLKSGDVVYNTFYPGSVSVDQFTCGKLGCAPGYKEYFKNYMVREVVCDGC